MEQQRFVGRGSGRKQGRLGSVVRIVTALGISVLSLPLLVAPAHAASATELLAAVDGVAPATASGTDGTGHDDDIYRSSKENQAPTQWQGGSGLVDTGSDVTALYADQATDATGNVWFYLGLARHDDGVAASVVELNKLPDVSSNGIQVPDRSTDDLRITFSQDNGGAPLSEYAVQRWDGSGWAAPVALGSGAYRSATSSDGLFAEFAIDLSAVGLMPSCDSGFTQVNVRTRSSDKDNSELKDYVAPLSVNVQSRCRAITVQKYDATTHQPLGGVQFQLFADNDGSGTLSTGDTTVGPAVTASQGSDANSYTWSDLPWGGYLVQETGRPAGYEADADGDVQAVVLDASTPNDGTAVVRFDNPEIKAAIQVQKYDAATGRPLSGASFQLWQDDGDGSFDPSTDTAVGSVQPADQPTGTGTVGNSHTWTDREYGTYFVQETDAPAGYDTAQPEKVTLTPADAGGTKTVRFDDAPLTPTIVVTKHDPAGNPLSGAGFTLYADDGDGTFDVRQDTKLGAEATAGQGPDANSHTWDTGLTWGTYFVRETTTPAGYGSDPKATGGVKKVALPATTPGGVATVDFADPRLTAGITARKFDFDTHDPLPGAKFTVYTDDNHSGELDAGDTPVGAEQAADGGPDHNTVTWTGLAWGQDYLVAETTPPAGYDGDLAAVNGAKLVSLTKADAGGTKSVGFFDPKTKAAKNPGTITVFKTDVATGDALDGAVFKLYLDSNGDQQPQPGELRYSNPPRLAEGTYQWQIEPGDYLVVEAAAPPGYTLPANPVQPVTVGAGGNATVAFTDAQILSTITVTKTDASTGAPLTGATFTLSGNGATQTGVTDKTGTITWSHLRMGSYTVTETAAPAGYTLPATTSQAVDIDADHAGDTMPLAFQDTEKTSTIVVHKYDAGTNAPLDGATFTLTRTGTALGAPTRTAAGTYEWTGLPMGTYTVTETAPPAGYLSPDQDSLPAGPGQDALFDSSTAGGTAVLDFYDERQPATPTPGGPGTGPTPGGPGTGPTPGAAGTDLVVTKRDKVSGDPIGTATFQLYGDDGDGVFTPADPAHGGPQQTAHGRVRWSDLPVGTYFVQETAAPQGYGTGPVLTVTIDPSQAGDTVRRDVRDPRLPTTLQVRKVDDLTGQPLAGATFRAYTDLNGNGRLDRGDPAVGHPRVTGADGLTSWSGLGFGRYLLAETAAPVGYGLGADRAQAVVVDRGNAGGVLQVTFGDPAQSAFALTKSALEQSAAGRWVPSDGKVGFGDRLQYVVRVRVSGPHLAHDVRISDYLPGYAPGDTASTARTSYIGGSARCASASCTPTYDARTGRLEWRLGNLPGGAIRTVRFVVRMPGRPAHATYVHGIYTATLVNVAEATWQQPVASVGASGARVAGYVARSVRSNTVRTSALDGPLILGEPATRPRDGGPATGGLPDSGLPNSGLPNTGAPAHTGAFTLLGGLSVLCGGWLMLRRPNLQRRPGRDSVGS